MDAVDPKPSPVRRPRRLTVAIIACCAVMATLLVGLIAVSLTREDTSPRGSGPVEKLDPNGTYPIPQPDAPDASQMLRAEITLPTGEATTLGDQLTEKPLLINLWASTCGPCVREMPWLQSVAASDQRVKVVGVAAELNLDEAQKRARSTGIAYDWFHDPRGRMLAAGETTGLPDTFLISADGRMLGAKAGAFSDEAAIRAWITEHLESGK